MSGTAPLPATVELCQRPRELGRPCLGQLYRPQPDTVYCYTCGGKDPGDLYVPILSGEQSAELQRTLGNLRGILEAYKAHHAHFHADCNIDGPAIPPRPGAQDLRADALMVLRLLDRWATIQQTWDEDKADYVARYHQAGEALLAGLTAFRIHHPTALTGKE